MSDSDEDFSSARGTFLFMEAVRTFHDTMKLVHEQAQEEEEANVERIPRSRTYYQRDREGAHARLYANYFSDNPTWGAVVFRRRFRMRKELFLRIVHELEVHDPFFVAGQDATGRQAISSLVKCTNALRQLANACGPDAYDEYLHVAETTGYLCLKKFCEGIVAVFGAEYLRRPTRVDVARLLQMHEQKHGFPGMLGSIDCMHWAWKNCPTSWRGSHTSGMKGYPTLILEVVASQDLWIWHAFFGVAGSNNDINVLHKSDVFNEVLQGKAPPVKFKANGREYKMGYYLADGIYPKWPVFVKTIPVPTEPKRCNFAQLQESARKDVERAFGVLQARWAILRHPAKLWYVENLQTIMYACIIMHNMIIEDEGECATDWEDETSSSSSSQPQYEVGNSAHFKAYMERHMDMRDKRSAQQLEDDLIEEMWMRFGHDE